MKIFTVEYIPKHADDMVLDDEQCASESMYQIMETVNTIIHNVTGRIRIDVWEEGKRIGCKFFDISIDAYGNIEIYLKGFTS